MKRQVLSSVLTAGLLVIAAVSSAYAGQSATLTAKVPFAFSVGAVSLPAGDYTIYEATNGFITIVSAHRIECRLLSHIGTSAKNDGNARITFHRYGDQYILAEVFNGTEDASLKLWTSKLEKDLIGAAPHDVSENSRQPDVVVFGTR